MKTLKNLLPLFAIILGVGLVFTQSAFKSSAKKSALMFQYQESDDSRINDETAWTDVTNNAPESCSEGNVLPCVIQFDTTDYPDLSAYLAAHPTVQDIKNDDQYLVSQKAGVINP